MEITHNTDDSVTDLTSLGEGKEIKKKRGIVIFIPRLSWTLQLDSFCKSAFKAQPQKVQVMYLCWRYSHQCAYVHDGEHVSELLSLC